MLALTKKTDYALIAMSHMARSGDGWSSAREIADLYHVSLPLLMNVLKLLTRHGLVRSTRGAKGGYALDEAAETITLDRMIDAVEGPLRLARCEPRDGGTGSACGLLNTCPIRTPVHRVQTKLQDFLSEITLREIASDRPEAAPRETPAVGVGA